MASAAQYWSPRVRAAAVASILIINLTLRLCLALRPLGFIDARTLPDDTYLSLTIARNIARGEGPSYSGEFTNGFQPLMVYMLAPVFLVAGSDPTVGVHAATAISSLFDTLTLLVLCRMILRRCRGPVPLGVAALAWILNPAGLRTAANGMETSMACFFLASGLSFLDRWAVTGKACARPRTYALLGALAGAGMLARIDLAAFAVSAAGTIFVIDRRELRRAFVLSAAFAAGLIIVEGPWLAYGYVRTGELFPVSGSAIRFMSLATVDFAPTYHNWYSLTLGEGVRALIADTRAALAVTAGLLCVLAWMDRRALRDAGRSCAWIVPACACTAILFWAYTLYVFGTWFFERYMFPACVPLTIALAAACDVLVHSRVRRPVKNVSLAAAVMLLIALDLTDPALGRTLFPSVQAPGGYMPIGLWAARRFPPGTVIAGAQSGALGYFADSLTVINLDGVVSPSCYRALRSFRALQYLRAHGTRYVVGWYSNFQYLEHQSAGMEPHDLGPLRPITGFRTWGDDWYFAEVR